MSMDYERVEVASRPALRAWLAANHARDEGIWLVFYKKAAGERHLPYEHVVEEALCFGWIDSRGRALDELRTMLLISPRKPGSAWSKDNKERVERLIANGLMHESGLAKIEAAKRHGTWTVLDDVHAGVIPDDLAQAFERHEGSRSNFDAFPASSRRIILEWVKLAKRPETRARRVEEAAEKASRNVRANHPRQ